MALIAVFLAGVCMIVVGVGEQTLIQAAVESAMRGRVMSLYGMISRGGPAVGALAMGTLSDWVGLRWPVAGGAVIAFGLWVWAKRREREIAECLEIEPKPSS